MHLKEAHKTAILIFANSPEEEAKRKPIPSGEGLFNILTKQTLETVAKSKLPYYHFSEKQQTGESFGERFTNAIQSVLSKGYEEIIAIGNDSPQLKIKHILNAKKQLKNKKVILGPTMDGGFYLMGITRNDFEPETLKNLPWQTSQLRNSFNLALEKNNIVPVQLEVLYDLDSEKDLKTVLTSVCFLKRSIRKVIIKIISLKFTTKHPFLIFRAFIFSSNSYNKGSPLKLNRITLH